MNILQLNVEKDKLLKMENVFGELVEKKLKRFT